MPSRFMNKIDADKAKVRMVEDEAKDSTNWTFEVRQASDGHWYIVAFDDMGEFIGVM